MALAIPVLGCSPVPLTSFDAGPLDAPDASGGRVLSDASGPTEAGPSFGSDAGTTTVSGCPGAVTCQQLGDNCGPIGDGCGHVLDCGTCGSGQSCGGGGKPSSCGAPACTPMTCGGLGFNCGPAGDGCGGQLDCGSCSGADTCGGGGSPGVCGHGDLCTPGTCSSLGLDCGPAGDGCGGLLNCGTCNAPQACGGGGQASVCGAPVCVPLTCGSIGPATCGPVGDGCGGLLNCGTCDLPETCGAVSANQCGILPSCTNLCLSQVSCSSGTTTISGIVYAPNGTDPLTNALVYVPNGPVAPFTPGVSCDNCGAAVSGSPLVSATTGPDGTFVISNAPVGSDIPLVIQIGRWRRQVTVASVTPCQDNPQPGALTRLPQNQGEGDIPLMAFSTGQVDALECVLRKIGVADTEFTAPGGGGRIQLYTGDAAPGENAGSSTPDESQLWGNLSTLNQYDMVLFPCQGLASNPALTGTAQQNVIDYANAGGRVFATHYSYLWLYDDAPFSSTANWEVNQETAPANQTGLVDMTFPKGQALAEWLVNVGASTTLGQIALQNLRSDMTTVIAPSQSWITINSPSAVTHYTFNTPVGTPAASQCGRVLYDDFHVEQVADSEVTFPGACDSNPMSPQEKLLEFMIFDLGSCISSDQPTCTPTTCAAQGIQCGPAGDGCGGVLQCGGCTLPQTCGGGGVPSVCGSPTCTPTTCAAQGIQCGPAGDGCGSELECGKCTLPETCGGGGQAGQCGSGPCTPTTCAAQGIQCGPAGDGCGNVLQCGTCSAGEACGGGGKPGQCGSECTPLTCAQLGYNCGAAGDGCGGQLNCGTCAIPQTCGGGSAPNVCGGGAQ
jgi:hypothetical protein